MDDLKLSGSHDNDFDSLAISVIILSRDLGREFGMNKCVVLKKKR